MPAYKKSRSIRRVASVTLITILIALTTPYSTDTGVLFIWAKESDNYTTALTDRSNDVGVPSEGYEDSPYTVSREIIAGGDADTLPSESNVGGTLYMRGGIRQYLNDQYWDAEKPFRITSVAGAEGQIIRFTTVNDFSLEDDDDVVPYGALKFDHVTLGADQPRQNIYARGNKLVMGEGVATEPETPVLSRAIDWRIYGGTEHNRDLSGNGRPDITTNVVVADGDWNYVFGGGEGATGSGTQVTVRGNANITNLYGGGERKGSIGVDEPTVNGKQGNPNNPGINVYVEGGSIGTLYGGSAINGKGWLGLDDTHALVINEDIKVKVSGGYVARLFGGDDTHDDNGDSDGVQPVGHTVMSDSPINGDLFVDLSGQNVAGTVVGDVNRNIPRAAINVRQVQGIDRLNITADQELQYAELFDVVNIDGANVKMQNEMGFTVFDSDYSSTEGYVGQIVVQNGGCLELTKRAIVNVPYAHYDNTGSWNYNWTEPDKAIKATGNHEAYYLVHGFVGESSGAERADSVLAINGNTAGITAASGERFNDSTDIAGLLIHGSVLGSMGGTHSWNSDAPGYSTLEATGDPVYSEGDDYYYYVVSDGTASNRTGTTSTAQASVNGGEAFREPEGADYMVCYRYLENGKIGWYLRERPGISARNIFVHTGEDTSAAYVKAHVDMNGMSYEWSDDADTNRVGIDVTKYTGTSDPTSRDMSIMPAELADIANDNRFSNVVYDSEGRLESFDVILDTSAADDAAYYDIGVSYQQDDERTGAKTDCVRAVYDFVNTTEPGSSDYQDSIMTTMPYSSVPVGADKARLMVYLPYGTEASALTVREDNGYFSMTDEDTADIVLASLHAADTVISDYEGVTTVTANSAFAVRIGGSDLSAGISKNGLSASNEYTCEVLSYKNVSRYEISDGPGDLNGLKLSLALSGITKYGESVGSGDPSAENKGELRIRTVPPESEVVPPLTGVPEQEEGPNMVMIPVLLFIQLTSLYVLLMKLRRH